MNPALLLIVPLGVVAAWIAGANLGGRLETQARWRRRAWKAGDRCLGCGYPFEGLSDEAPCPECGLRRTDPPPFKVPVVWLGVIWGIGVVGVPALCVIMATPGWSLGLVESVLYGSLFNMPFLLLAALLVGWFWPCGARMRWSLAGCVMGTSLVLVCLSLDAELHDPTFDEYFGFRFLLGFVAGAFIVPALLGPAIVVGYALNRLGHPIRPGLS